MDSGLVKVTDRGKVYAHLDEEEILAIAQAVCNEMDNRAGEKELAKTKRLAEEFQRINARRICD